MSKTIRLACFGVFAAIATVAIAQQNSSLRLAGRSDKPKTISPTDSDFGRFRVSTDQGVLVVYDGAEAAAGRNAAIPQIAYWNDYSTEQLFFFNQLLLSRADVAHAVSALERDIGIDIEPVTNSRPNLASEPPSPLVHVGRWRAASGEAVLAVMVGKPSENIEGSVSGLE